MSSGAGKIEKLILCAQLIVTINRCMQNKHLPKGWRPLQYVANYCPRAGRCSRCTGKFKGKNCQLSWCCKNPGEENVMLAEPFNSMDDRVEHCACWNLPAIKDLGKDIKAGSPHQDQVGNRALAHQDQVGNRALAAWAQATRQWPEVSDFVACFCTLHESNNTLPCENSTHFTCDEMRAILAWQCVVWLAWPCVVWLAQHAKMCDTRATAYRPPGPVIQALQS